MSGDRWGAAGAQRVLAGIALVIAAVACFTVLDTTTKYISAWTPLLMALWFRYAFQAVVTTATMLPVRGRALLRTAHPKFQVLRGVLLLLTSLFAFLSLKFLHCFGDDFRMSEEISVDDPFDFGVLFGAELWGRLALIIGRCGCHK